jgi:carbon storage regulator
MLVLARKLGQSIIIDGCTEVTVVEVRGDQVRLGITAPRTISIYRSELLDQIRAENVAAASTANLDDTLDVTAHEDQGNTNTDHTKVKSKKQA